MNIILSILSLGCLAVLLLVKPEFLEAKPPYIFLLIAGLASCTLGLLYSEIPLVYPAAFVYAFYSAYQDLLVRKLSRWHARATYPLGIALAFFWFDKLDFTSWLSHFVFLAVPVLLFLGVMITPKTLKLFPAGDIRLLFAVFSLSFIDPEINTALITYLGGSLVFLLQAIYAYTKTRKAKTKQPLAPAYMSALCLGLVLNLIA